jgi:hypothetical protein
MAEPSSGTPSSGNRWLAPMLITIISGIIVGIAVYWGTVGLPFLTKSDDEGSSQETPDGGQTTGPGQTEDPETPGPVLSFQERVAGQWQVQSWTEAGGPVTLYIEVESGTMTVSGGDADWRLDIDQRGEDNSPQPGIKCGARATLDGKIEGQPGGDRNAEIDWTSDLRSVDHSTTGEDWIWRALCGWTTIGGRYPYEVTLAGDATAPATQMEMSNQWGTFVWVRSS